ncbi:MAG TPA: M20/M25/M40 family metallo-hydrolase, partial [Gemmatimonadaceae bacterium]
MRFVLSAVVTAALPALLSAQTQASALRPEQQLAHDIYKELVEINTADSVGSTTVAANAVAKRLREAGFAESDIFQGGPKPDKGNIVVRYHGTGARKPLLLLAHLDVVQALKTDWSPDIDPFKFTERDGYYYGRGTGDDKAMGSIFIANLIRYKKEGFVPDRDIILALTADEEGGGSNGVRWLIANHKDLIDAAYALNEGGGGALRDGKPFINSIGAAEKVSANFTVSTSNRGGHSSVPRDDNAIYQLAEALTKIG